MTKKQRVVRDAIDGDQRDRLSELLEHIIQHIHSFLPLQDAAQSCILSKTWNRVCNSNPILYFDYNLFVSQFLRQKTIADHQTNYDQKIQMGKASKDMFMDHVEYHLLRVIQQNLPVRKLTLNWWMTEDDSIKCFPRVDHWMELLNQAPSVKELCLSVRAFHKKHSRPCCFFIQPCYKKHSTWSRMRYSRVPSRPSRSRSAWSRTGYRIPYKLQQFRVLATKELQCLTLSLCKFETSDGHHQHNDNMVGLTLARSLKQLHLSEVIIHENDLHNWARCCPVIEVLEFQKCCIYTEIWELSSFAKSLKKVSLYETKTKINCVDIRGTNLESFKCESRMFCKIDKSACMRIRELVLGKEATGWGNHDLFQDLATTFPVLEEARIRTKFLHSRVTRFRVAKHYHLRTLYIKLDNLGFKEFYLIDCSNLTSLTCKGDGLKVVYVDCPNLREFCYSGTTVPAMVFNNLSARLEKMKWKITMPEDHLINTFWFVKLKKTIIQTSPRICDLEFFIRSRTVAFCLEELDPNQIFPQGNSSVNLAVRMRQNIIMQNQAALVDGMLWSIRPSTLTISGKCYDFVKHLCDKLLDKSEESFCEKQFCSKHWWHHIEDFEVESLDIMRNLPGILEYKYRQTYESSSCFRFHWSS